MSKPRRRKPEAQVDRFIETARELECDEDKERFEEKLGKIAKAKPDKKPKEAK
ncbi:MAG: hypothetical protein ACREDL_00900 [Bradyrhizobium sp.]